MTRASCTRQSLARQREFGDESGGGVAQRHVAAVPAGDVARDAQAEAGAPAFHIARIIEPVERLEYPLKLWIRYARAAVTDSDPEVLRRIGDLDFRRAPISDRVLDQVVEAAAQALRIGAVGT